MEREGIRRAAEQALAADLVLSVVDATARARASPAAPLAVVPSAAPCGMLVSEINIHASGTT